MTSRLAQRLAAPVAALAIVPVLAAVLKRAVDMPFGDEWEWIELIYAAHTHALTFAQLWMPHNEHRIFVPNVIMLALDAAGGWDVVREQLVSLAMLAATQFFVWLIVRRTVSQTRSGVCFLAASILLFGFVQWENYQWGFQMAWFLCDLCVVVTVWALSRPGRTVRDVAFAAAVATVASFSSSQGLLAWPCGLIAIALIPRRVVQTAVIWVLLAVFVAALARNGTSSVAEGHVGLRNVALLVHYAVIYLGAPLGSYRGLDGSTIAGAVWCVWAAGLAGAALRGAPSRRVRSAPWVALAAYPVLAALATGSGRAGFGLLQASSSRYASISALAWVAVLAATFVIVPRGRVAFAALAAAVVVAFSVRESIDANRFWKMRVADMRAARAALSAGDIAQIRLVYPDPRRAAMLLHELGDVGDGLFSPP